MPVDRINHSGWRLRDRDDLLENEVFSYSIEHVLYQLKEGDRLRLQREGKSYPQIYVTVVDPTPGDYVVVEDEDGREYDLWGRWEYNLDDFPWLRRNGESAGMVTRLTVVEKVDEP